jgi:hypothetical protein
MIFVKIIVISMIILLRLTSCLYLWKASEVFFSNRLSFGRFDLSSDVLGGLSGRSGFIREVTFIGVFGGMLLCFEMW